ncbi:MAG TPA: M20/M25/M40 family metallo-hydrolase [Gemmatimonadaceae bacterium]|nr:M20/M25/M40 family metallo-hydrolase [Gemmatimonadaceae bacterium]
MTQHQHPRLRKHLSRQHVSPFGRARALVAALATAGALAAPLAAPLAAQEKVDDATIERIKSEEMNNSHVMDIMSWLSDVYGPRLTWSPNATRAGTWAMSQMKSWGLANVHEETWDTPAGLGWENEHFSMMATAPVPFIVEAVPQAWSVGTVGAVSGPAMLVQAGCTDELRQQYAGKLKNAFILTAPPRNQPVNAFDATAKRLTDSALAVLEAAQPGGGGRGGRGGRGGNAPERSPVCQRQFARDSAAAAASGRGGRGGFGGGRGGLNVGDTTTIRWLENQGVAGLLLGDATHVGGDIGTNNGASRVTGAPHVPTVHVAQESYGRIARMLEKKVTVRLQLDMQNKFFPANKTSFNIVGEIPGTDPALKNQVVMIGAHFDSWHSGTGATDNGAGSGVMLEAMRLLKTLDVKPRRTIRIALWTGEEEGLLGSRAYVAQHFGTRDSTGFHAKPEQKTLAAYFNVDNGSGKIRGVYLQGIEAERPIFDAWMGPFKNSGMKTLTINNTGGTDHLSYIGVGLPGFQFIQDPLDYGNVTHHTNQDVYERLQPDDMKFNAAVVASFAWQAAQRDEMLPRPPEPEALQAGRGRGGAGGR